MRRPGGNTTGVSLLAPELDGKRQDLIMEAVPGIRRIATLADPNVATPQHLQTLTDAARARGVELSVFFRIHARRDRTSYERGERLGG
jgi:putative ABC transport system substrate-binding protein